MREGHPSHFADWVEDALLDREMDLPRFHPAAQRAGVRERHMQVMPQTYASIPNGQARVSVFDPSRMDEGLSDTPSLLSYLHHKNPEAAGYIEAIRGTACEILRGSSLNDFAHSETVVDRLGELVKGTGSVRLSDIEVFVLLASAYLHDIRKKDATEPGQDHGALSADNIETHTSLKFLFPHDSIKAQVGQVCRAHTWLRAKLSDLDDVAEVTLRRGHTVWFLKRTIRPRLLAALLMLADELDTMSDRTRAAYAGEAEPRNRIAGVTIDSAARTIHPSFHRCVSPADRSHCLDYLERVLRELRPFLAPHRLDYHLQTRRCPPEQDDAAEGAVYEGVSRQPATFPSAPVSAHAKPLSSEELAALLEKLESARLDQVRAFATPKRKEPER